MGAQCGPGDALPVSNNFVKATNWNAVAYRPNTAVLAPTQIGAYGDVVLTKQYAISPGVQRRSRGFNPTGWMVDSRSELPYWQQTVTPGNVTGGQRFGSQAHNGQLTPWVAAQMQGALVAAQIKQSGLAAVQFNRALVDANMSAA